MRGRTFSTMLKQEVSLVARRGSWYLAHQLGGRKVDQALMRLRTGNYTVIKDVSPEFGTPLAAMFRSQSQGFAIDLSGNFGTIYERQLDWVSDRLRVSTAGYRGCISVAELSQINADITTEALNYLLELEVDPALKYKSEDKELVCLAVIMATSQGIANWINANFQPAERRIFIGNDVRFFSKEARDITARIYLANGIEVYMDTEEYTATPVTSYAANWLNTRLSVMDVVRELINSDRLNAFLEKRREEKPFVAMLSEESGGAMFGLLKPIFNRVRRSVFKSVGAIQKTSSHNPAGENGEKVSDKHGGVAADSITGKQADTILELLQSKGSIYVAPKNALARVKRIDAKEIYWENYAKYAFTREVLEPLARAVAQGHSYMFDGLEGVGGETFRFFIRKFEQVLGQPGSLSKGIEVTNPDADPLLGRIKRPDPTLPETVDESGDLQKLADKLNIRCFTLADADADRTGTGVRLIATGGGPADKSPEVMDARRLGIFVSILKTKGNSEVPILRFTANQLYAVLAFARCLDFIADQYGISDMHEAISAVREGRISIPNSYFLTTIASSKLLSAVARFFGGEIITTAVGFKYLGNEVTKLEDKQTKLAHHDKDTSVMSAYLFALDAKLAIQDMTMLDFYKLMANELGELFYYDREDIYFRTSRTKDEINDKALSLEKVENASVVAKAFGKQILSVEDNVEIEGVIMMDKTGEEYSDFIPQGYRIRFTDNTYMDVYHVGAKGKDGPGFFMYDTDEKLIFWSILRVSGTENLIRFYREVSENPNAPKPEHLFSYFYDFASYLGISQESLFKIVKRVAERYNPDLKSKLGRVLPIEATKPADDKQYSEEEFAKWNQIALAAILQTD